MENYSGNMDTMLDSTVLVPSSCYHNVAKPQSDSGNNVESTIASESGVTDADALVIAPGEGQRPIALFNDPDAEYLAFSH